MVKEQELVSWGWPVSLMQWQKNNWVNYRLTTDKWRDFYDRQEGKCAGCREELANPLVKAGKVGLKPQVDHRHRKDVRGEELQCETADVRGLLCGECNRLLGKIQDNRTVLANLLAYLKQHGDY